MERPFFRAADPHLPLSFILPVHHRSPDIGPATIQFPTRYLHGDDLRLLALM